MESQNLRGRSRHWPSLVPLLLILGALSACGGGGGGGAGGGTSTPSGGTSQPADALDASLYPLNAGDTRAWRSADDPQGLRLRIERVDASVTLPSGAAFHVRSTSDRGLTVDEEYLQVRSTGVHSMPGPGSDPITGALGGVQVFRAGLALGQTATLVDQTLSVDVDGDGRADSLALHVDSTFVGRESVTTPLGTFAGTAHVRTVGRTVIRTAAGADGITTVFTEDRWYAPGVGPIRARSSTERNGTRTDSSDEDVVAYGVGSRHQPSVATGVQRTIPTAGLQRTAPTYMIVTFDHAVDPLSLWGERGIELVDASGRAVPLNHDVPSQNLTEITVWPQTPLGDGSYTLRHAGKATDLAGVPLPQTLLSFQVDLRAPQLVSSQPAQGELQASLTAPLRLSFSAPIFTSGGKQPTIELWEPTQSARILPAQIQGNDLVANLPEPLRPNVHYTINPGPGLMDRAGQDAIYQPVSFTTTGGALLPPQGLMDGWIVGTVRKADLSGPGSQDLALLATSTSTQRKSLFTRTRRPDGTWAAPVRRVDFTATGSPFAEVITPGDFNSDGRTDLLVTSGDVRALLLQQSDGSFVEESLGDAADQLQAGIVGGGVDPDGKAYVAQTGTWLKVWRRMGPQAWAARIMMPPGGAPGSVPAGATLGDLNVDGQLDWVWIRDEAGGSGRQELVWSLRNGDSYGADYLRTIEGHYSRRILVGDWNGDGRPGLVIINGQNASAIPLQLWTQNVAGGLEPAFTTGGGRTFTDGQLGDLNRDGRLDLLLCRGSVVEVWLRTAAGGWQSPQDFDMPEGCDGMQVLDWNGDGIPDIVARGRVLLGRSDGAWPVAQRPAAAIATPRPGRLPGAMDAARALAGRRAP